MQVRGTDRAGRLDYGQLTQPIDGPRLDAFIADSKSTGKPWKVMTKRASSAAGSREDHLPVDAGGDSGDRHPSFIVFTGGPSLISAVWRFTLEAPFPWNLVIVGFVVLIVFGVLMVLLRVLSVIRWLIVPRWWWEAVYRLVAFAAPTNCGTDTTRRPPTPV